MQWQNHITHELKRERKIVTNFIFPRLDRHTRMHWSPDIAAKSSQITVFTKLIIIF